MSKPGLKYNQDFKKKDIVEDLFEEIEYLQKDDEKVLNLNNRTPQDKDISKNNKENASIKSIVGIFSLLFFVVLTGAIFVFLAFFEIKK